MAILRGGLEQMLAGRGQMILLVGEPGIGKTRTAEEVASRAVALGTRVIWGRCYEWEGAPAYWPWIELLRQAVTNIDAEHLGILLGYGAAHIGQIIPEVRDRLSNLPDLPRMSPEQARFQLFDSIRTFFLNFANTTPLVIVLDDLHWADQSSLLLLQFLVHGIRDSHILLVGTYRDVEVNLQHPLNNALAEFARIPWIQRVGLSGLHRNEVERFISLTAGTNPPEVVVKAVYQETEGNPFFVAEIVRLLLAEGRMVDLDAPAPAPLRVPESVRQVIGHRLARLSAESNRILSVASIIGREFSLRLLEAVTQQSTNDLLDLLDAAVQARLIEEIGTAGQYRFVHALIQETLYEELSIAQRMRLHGRVGEALEQIQNADLTPYYAELAHHFSRAAAAGYADRAVRYSVRAGDHAMALLAWTEAVDHYRMAIQILDLQGDQSPLQLCNALLSLGEAQNRSATARLLPDGVVRLGAGGSLAGRATFWRAAEVARDAALPEELAQAALGVAGFNPHAHQGGVEGVQLLEEALAQLPPDDSPLRVRVLARLGTDPYMLTWLGKLSLTPELEERFRSRSDEAVAMGRRLGDPITLAYALAMRNLRYELHPPDERVRVADEIIALAMPANDLQLVAWALVQKEYSLLQLGEMAIARDALDQRVRVAEQLRLPYFIWFAETGLAGAMLRTGQFDKAEQHIERANAIQPKSGGATIELISLRREQGRFDELLGLLDRFASTVPDAPMIRSLRLICLLESGQPDAVREGFEVFAATGFSSWTLTLRGLSWLAEICVALDDRARAVLLYDRLLPLAEQNVITGATDLTGGCVSYYLGRLATTMMRWSDAELHFTTALTKNEQWGIRPYTAYTRYAWADMLLRRDSRGDRTRALALLDQALAAAVEMGMIRLMQKSREVRDSLVSMLPSSDTLQIAPANGLSPRELDVLRLIAAGRTDREIAEALCISPRTVTTHVTHILNKLAVNTRTEAAARAVRDSIL